MKIEKVQERVTKKGQPYLYVEFDGDHASCFQTYSYLWPIIKEGEDIPLDVMTSGDFKNIVGIEGILSPEKPGRDKMTKNMDRKEAGIAKSTDRKENSIKVSAAKRDSAMFAASPKSREELLEEYKHWAKYFRKVYELEEKEEI